MLAPRGRAWFLRDGAAGSGPGLRMRQTAALGAWQWMAAFAYCIDIQYFDLQRLYPGLFSDVTVIISSKRADESDNAAYRLRRLAINEQVINVPDRPITALPDQALIS